MLVFKIKIGAVAFFALLCLQGSTPSSISTIDKYGEEYDLSQKMSINMQIILHMQDIHKMLSQMQELMMLYSVIKFKP